MCCVYAFVCSEHARPLQMAALPCHVQATTRSKRKTSEKAKHNTMRTFKSQYQDLLGRAGIHAFSRKERRVKTEREKNPTVLVLQ